jgi:ATP/maltotriose-dependent transcriptional regulator MalT/DNA-binding SARP family transcriptional activator
MTGASLNLAKLRPPSSSRALERDRLLNKLQEWDEKKLIIIHGQAGQGKSTLVATYVHAGAAPAAWYTLDQEDADPAVFLAGLAEALKRIWPDQTFSLPRRAQNDFSAPREESLHRWITGTFSNLRQPGLIVLDDYHALPSPKEFDLVLRALIDATPPQIRFIIISRAQPSLEVARLRARRTLGVLTGQDLAFNDRETHDLFCDVFGMPLDRAESAHINRRTEGWPAGLVLTHEYLAQSSPQNSRALFGANHVDKFQPPVFEYLAQEVFSLLAPDLQEFLLRTSITNSLPLGLIRQLTGLPLTTTAGKSSVASLVEQLQNRNLFISVADDEGVVRYHALFHEFLLKKLQTETKPALVQKLFTTAIRYFEQANDPVRAIDLSLAAGQVEKAILLIEAGGRDVLARGQVQTLLRWIGMLPAHEQDRPWFLFFRANALRFSAPGEALLLLDRALAGFRNEKKASCRSLGQMVCLCGIIEACFHSGGDFQRMGRTALLARALLKRTSRVSTAARARLLLALGMAWFFIGKLEEATDALTQARNIFSKQNDPVSCITGVLYLVPSALYQGDFRLAREALRKGFETLAAIPDDKASQGALLLIQAMTALFEGKFSEAEESLGQCTTLVDTHALGSIGSLALVIGGWLKIAQGDHHAAARLLDECKRKGAEMQDAFFIASAAHLLAISQMFQRRLVKAKAQSDHALSIRTQSGSRLFHAIYLITSGAILMKLGRLLHAERELLDALRMLKQVKAAQQEANAHLVLAQLYGKTGKTTLVNSHLRAGFSIGQDREFTYYALFDAAELAQLAEQAVAQDICTEHCTDLLGILSGTRQVSRLQVYCLGDFRVELDQAALSDSAWKSKRAKTLLKMLLAQDDHKLLRDRVLEMLWPDDDPEKQRVAYNVLLHRMRKALEPDGGPEPGKDVFCIQNDHDVLALNSTRVWTDVAEFRKRFGLATRLKRAKDAGKALEAYESTLAVYKGDFLPDDAYNDWAVDARERLRSHYHKALEDAGEIAEFLEDRNKAAHFYDLRFSSDPCNEKSCRWLMTWHIDNGHRSEAVRTYERCERALSRDMDMEPEEQTRKIYRRIIGG